MFICLLPDFCRIAGFSENLKLVGCLIFRCMKDVYDDFCHAGEILTGDTAVAGRISRNCHFLYFPRHMDVSDEDGI